MSRCSSANFHANARPATFTRTARHDVPRLIEEIAYDPDNTILVMTGTRERFMTEGVERDASELQRRLIAALPPGVLYSRAKHVILNAAIKCPGDWGSRGATAEIPAPLLESHPRPLGNRWCDAPPRNVKHEPALNAFALTFEGRVEINN